MSARQEREGLVPSKSDLWEGKTPGEYAKDSNIAFITK